MYSGAPLGQGAIPRGRKPGQARSCKGGRGPTCCVGPTRQPCSPVIFAPGSRPHPGLTPAPQVKPSAVQVRVLPALRPGQGDGRCEAGAAPSWQLLPGNRDDTRAPRRPARDQLSRRHAIERREGHGGRRKNRPRATPRPFVPGRSASRCPQCAVGAPASAGSESASGQAPRGA